MTESDCEATGGVRLAGTGRAALLAVVAVAIVVVPVVLHEAAHVAAALIGGVSPSAMEVGFVGVYPGVLLDEPLAGWRFDLFRWAPGLVAGAALLAVYVRWYWKWSGDKTSFAGWWFGALILFVAGNEFGNGVSEGAFYDEYLANREPAAIISVGAALAGYLVHRTLLGSRGARLAVMRGAAGDRNQIEEAVRRETVVTPRRYDDGVEP